VFVLLDGLGQTVTSETKHVHHLVHLMELALLLPVNVFVLQDGKETTVILYFALLVTSEEVFVILVFVNVFLFGLDSSVTFQLDHVLITVLAAVIFLLLEEDVTVSQVSVFATLVGKEQYVMKNLVL